MPDYKVIIEGIDEIVEAQKVQTQGILKCIEANAIVTNMELKGIKDHLSTINGTIVTLQKESELRKQAVLDFREHQKFGKWVHKNWWVVLLLFVGSVVLIVGLLDYFGLRELWNIVKEIK